MSDIAIGRADGGGAIGRAGGESAFGRGSAVLVVAIGIVAFVAMLVIGAYAPALRSGRNGGAHALSNAATGYAGLVQLAEATGRHPAVLRDEHRLDTENLLVATPETGLTDLSRILQARTVKPTLIVLPKWNTSANQTHRGWVDDEGLRGPMDPEGVLAPAYNLRVLRRRSVGVPLVAVRWAPPAMRFTEPPPLQYIAPAAVRTPTVLEPLITDAAGHIVLARLGDRPLYVLADPDLLSNMAMRDANQARAALALLDFLNSTGADGVAFDVTLNGLGRSPNLLALAFDPPFLAMTLAIAAALLLAGWQAFAQFGAPRRRERAIAFGKAALIDNAAALVRRARRERTLGGRYAYVIRERAASAFGAPARLRDAALDAYLDRVRGRHRFTDLANAAGAAKDGRELLAAAQALYDWQEEKA